MNKIIVIAIVVVIALGAVYFAITKNLWTNPKTTAYPSSTPTPHETPVGESVSPTPSKSPAASPSPVIHSVNIKNFSFVQASVIVKKGDTVVWTNEDSASHTVTGDGSLSSPTMNTNGTYSFTFNNTGTFSYHCGFHPSMTGTIIVTQ